MADTTPSTVDPEPGLRPVPLELHRLDDAELVCAHDGELIEDPAPPKEGCGGNGHTGSCAEEPADHESALFVEVVFKGERRGYYRNDAGVQLSEGMPVMVEAEKGVDVGYVGSTGTTAFMKSRLRTRPCQEQPRQVLRPADEKELRILAWHREQEDTAWQICMEKITRLGLPMKLVDVEYQFDRNRITFYFTADGRVDFRQLVRELAAEYRTRIELRQIGPRDEARRMGGFGVCGRELCCNAWIGTFEPISTDMARLQNLTLNPFKLAGQCGRLKCCLAYEARLYEELLKRFPPMDYKLRTTRGVGKIEKIDIFQDAIYVHYPDVDTWERLTLDEVNALMHRAPAPPAAPARRN